MLPCTLLVERELAITLPASCLLGMSSGIRSTKLVSSRLKAVVCELAMLPEMFSSAKDCARRPLTAGGRAAQNTHNSSPRCDRPQTQNAPLAARLLQTLQAPRQRKGRYISDSYIDLAGRKPGRMRRPPAKLTGPRDGKRDGTRDGKGTASAPRQAG